MGEPEAQRRTVNGPRSQQAWMEAPVRCLSDLHIPGERLVGKAMSRYQDRSPPTFSILVSETSIKMLNFLTAARPFSSAMIHLSMFFPRGQDTQSIILVRGVTVTQRPRRPKCLGGGNLGTSHNVLRSHTDSHLHRAGLGPLR